MLDHNYITMTVNLGVFSLYHNANLYTWGTQQYGQQLAQHTLNHNVVFFRI